MSHIETKKNLQRHQNDSAQFWAKLTEALSLFRKQAANGYRDESEMIEECFWRR
jgi:hypothetical protein